MEKFKLVSDYRPCGDQPKAIKKLTESVLSVRPYQTLLGVTGSGKSLDRKEPLLIFTKDSKNNYTPRLERIGDFIDNIMQDFKQNKILYNDTEIVFLNEKYYVLSLNPQNYQTEIKPITAFIRHLAPKKMYLIKTACGREAMVTSDHNFWVLRNGKLALLPTNQLRDIDYIPLPRNLPNLEKPLSFINLFQYLDKENFYVEVNKLLVRFTSLLGRKKIIDFFSIYFKSPYHKFYSISKNIKSKRIAIGIFLALLDKFKYALNQNELYGIKISAKTNSKHSLPAVILLKKDFLSFLGYFIAEGHAEDKYILITTFDKKIRRELISIFKNLNLLYTMRRNSDFQISSRLLAFLLKRLVGHSARNKRLPEFWTMLSQKQLAIMLRAYFEGDGTIGKNREVSATTASKDLASDLVYALSRFGIWARIKKVYKKAANTSHKGNWYWKISIYNQENLRIFAKKISFISRDKIDKLKSEISRRPHSNVDLIFGVGARLRQIREAIGLSQRNLAEAVGINRSAISLIEYDLRHPKTKTFQNLIHIFDSYPDNSSVNVGIIKGKIREIKDLSNCFWTPIVEVKTLTYKEPYVYDVSVKDNETFFAGYGGLFFHNTFTLANVIANVNLPTLVISHNKTLAAQLYSEFKEYFAHNAIEYFVSYYDYYQPEAYIPSTDTYIEKDASINDRLDRLRLSTTSSLMSRNDVLIVASVSCIYNLGSPEDYRELLVFIEKGQIISRDTLISRFIQIQYERNDYEFMRGRLRVRGDVVEIFPSYSQEALRIEFFGDKIEKISRIDPISGEILDALDKVAIYPAKHFIVSGSRIDAAVKSIEWELEDRLKFLRSKNKLLEAQRLEARTKYDMEMLKEIGYCHGIENYSRHLSGRPPGSRPYCLIDYFPDKFLTIIDESHVTIPQLHGMYEGDRSRKEILVEYGFRLPSCLDNRPLKFEEFEDLVKQVVFVSATPDEYEIKKSEDKVIEQIIRPTGLVDPEIMVKPTENQIEDLIEEIKGRSKNNERVLVTTLTKRMSEDLASYLQEKGLKVKYLHSEIETIERSKILRDLRRKDFDCLVGINLLREGLDLPEVSLVAILDADKEGFLRSATSLIQVAGRAARNINGSVIMYADTLTGSMKKAIAESNRRRKIQLEFNQINKITPRSIQKAIRQGIEDLEEAEEFVQDLTGEAKDEYELNKYISELEYEMELAARNLQFEKAAAIRDRIKGARIIFQQKK